MRVREMRGWSMGLSELGEALMKSEKKKSETTRDCQAAVRRTVPRLSCSQFMASLSSNIQEAEDITRVLIYWVYLHMIGIALHRLTRYSENYAWSNHLTRCMVWRIPTRKQKGSWRLLR